MIKSTYVNICISISNNLNHSLFSLSLLLHHAFIPGQSVLDCSWASGGSGLGEFKLETHLCMHLGNVCGVFHVQISDTEPSHYRNGLDRPLCKLIQCPDMSSLSEVKAETDAPSSFIPTFLFLKSPTFSFLLVPHLPI